jgi:CRISPR-associated protein Cas8c/Csd1 subtype I-C
MITELLQLYERTRQDISIDEPFVMRRIHWVIDLNEKGKVIGVSPAVSRNSDGKGKVKESLGKEYRCPAAFFLRLKEEKEKEHKIVSQPQKERKERAKGQQQREVVASAGGGNVPPELLTGKPLQIFGEEPIIKKDKKGNITERTADKAVKGIPKSNHDAFVALHKLFCDSLEIRNSPSPEWSALKSFFDQKQGIPFDAFSSQDLAQLTKDQRFSFRVNGRLLFQLPAATDWWRKEIKQKRESVRQWLPQGTDAFSQDSAIFDTPLAVRFPHIQGVPGGGGYCPIASFDKAPMQSFGLGEITMPLGLETAEKASAALNWLLSDETAHKRMGDSVFVFWAVDETATDSPPQPLDFGNLMSEADPLQVREFLKNAWGGYAQFPDTSRFYAAVLSSPQSRVTVRSWHTETLPQAVDHFRRWLELSILPDRWGAASPTSIAQLADCTIRKGKNSKPLPRTYSELFEAALFGRPLSSRLFAAALQRQANELAKGCDKKEGYEFEKRLRARTALIKLHFELNKKGEQSTMTNHTCQNDSAYLCGRLLALLDKIHIDAHGKSGGTNSSPANRAYAAASTTPALIFPQLCKLARYHLNKVGGGWANCLEHGYDAESGEFVEGLKQVVGRFQKADGCSFPRTLSLEQQGRFAIGFYFERCREWPPSKKKANAVGETSQSEISNSNIVE